MEKDLMLLANRVLTELGRRCGTDTTRDWNTVERRVENEGIEFLTISLPSYAQGLERGLDEGKIDPSNFEGYALKGRTPKFLGGFMDLIFDRDGGWLLKGPDSQVGYLTSDLERDFTLRRDDAIQAIRQFSLMFAKMSSECSQERNDAAVAKFLQCEDDLRRLELTEDMLSSFKRVSNLLWNNVIRGVEKRYLEHGIVPKHGPGATADGLRGNSKYLQVEWPSRLDKCFPDWEFLLPSQRFMENLDHLKVIEPGEERPVKVTLVPKTLKTPRIIAIEPTAMQYAQQGLLEAIREFLENSDYSRGFVGINDQTPNQRMARYGSVLGSNPLIGLATLDLSEASDRVSNQLVRTMFEDFPDLGECIQACRSSRAVMPDGSVIELVKFASMGSALTFPIEAMVFTTIIMMGIEKELNQPLTLKLLAELKSGVHVYGDDIIVPIDYVHSVIRQLEAFGLRVNRHKSFWNGKFRESCGKEYFDGADVSIVRVRSELPKSRTDVRAIVSTVSLRNQMYKSGMWETAAHLDRVLERIIPFPTVHENSPVLGRHTYLQYQVDRMCPSLHRPLVKGYAVKDNPPPSLLDGVGALMKVFLKRGDEPFDDEKHLVRQGRSRAVSIKLAWYPPF